MKKGSLLSLVLASLFFAFGPSQLRAERVVLGYGSLDGAQMVHWVTKSAGIFKKNNLDVQDVFIAGGAAIMQALLSGDVHVAHIGGGHVVNSVLNGVDTVMIAATSNTLDFTLFAAKHVRKPVDLKGGIVGVGRFGGSADIAVRYALSRWGLVPDRDVRVVQIGAQPERLAALQYGKVQATVVQPPTTLVAREMGFVELADMPALGMEFPTIGIVTRRKTIQDRRGVVEGFLRSVVEGIHYIKTHPKESMDVLGQKMKMTDVKAQEEAYNFYTKKIFRDVPLPTVAGFQFVMDQAAAYNPKVRAYSPKDFMDSSFLDDLVKSGFLARLKRSPS